MVDKNEDFAIVVFERALLDIRSHYAILIQIATALIIANLTIVSYASTVKNGGIILICSFFPSVIIFLIYFFSKMITPLIYSAISIEKYFNLPKVDWVASTYYTIFYNHDMVEKIETIIDIINNNDRMNVLSKINIPILGKATGLLYVILILLTLLHLILSFVFINYYGWKLF